MNWKLVILSLGMSLTFWDIFNVPYIINYAGTQFHASPLLASLPLSAEMIGYALGGALNGLLSSLRGRKPGLLLSMGLVAVGSLVGFVAQSFSWLIPAELLIGLGIEGELSVVPAYVSETVTPERRGRSVGLVTASGFLTTLVVGPIAVLLNGEWRFLFLAGLLVSLIALITRVKLPESKMWTERRGKLSFDLGIAIMTLVWFLSYFTGYALFADPVFQFIGSHGFTNTSLYFTYILYGDPLGVVLATVLNDKFERKFSVALVNILAGVVIVGWFFSSGLTFLLLGFAEMFLQGFKFPVMYTYTSEIFGTKIRTLGYGIADGLGHLGGAVGPILFASTYMSNQLSSFLMLSVVTALAGVIVLAWGVKTTGKPLEQIRG
ncbi:MULTISPECIES: MFS transporter [Metallosphaera]|uniref:Major facilitator superfamily MFS_1 n=3 Tax=Metallosphaera TaxID=41980 RepID=A4YDU1_METS5|nr:MULTISPECIES: MFS transporter [Metallosphaera]ABP94593.1 major facilitator superfamily MFS_1 [Metallosphaera sedula DSM 5348]AIM26580.1 major facilitator superfamily MFS_1 [Metallosphaera sedula]AKV73562.1 MFS transporter [Metallosphaera sedula]AKV75804.1 MFS transporter [Metallosphaera sedula]AKV78052.1 MFS transporter [Metallosphaera sedula]